MASISTLTDLVKIYCISTGVGAFQLGTPVPGFFGIEQLIDGAQYSYSVQLGANAETGTGIYSAASGSLTRNVQKSTNGNAAVSFGAGAAIAITALAQDLIATGGTLPIANALGNSPSVAIAQQAATDAINAKVDVSALADLLFSILSSLPDEANGGTVPAHGLYLSAGVLKVNP